MRKTYGNTWWGKEWLKSLTNIDFSNRLPRGRTYANKGLARDIQIEANRISAKVQGSRSKPYQVKFEIPKFNAREKASIIEIVTANPLYLSKLLNRDLPSDIKRVCDQKNIRLFPNTWHDLEGSCSCPDWAVPCKHMAAVLYLIANEIDQNPFLVFQLHDFDLFKGLEGIGYTAQGQEEVPIISTTNLQQNYTSDKLVKEWDEETYAQIDFTRIPDCKDNLLAILSEKPVFYPRGDFKKILSLAYAGIIKRLTKVTKQEEAESVLIDFDKIEDAEILLDEDWDFLNVTFRDSKGKMIFSFDKIAALLQTLEQVPLADFSKFSDSLKSLTLIYQLAKKLLERAACIPQLIRVGLKHYKIRWIPATLNQVVRSICDGVNSFSRTDFVFYKKQNTIAEPIASDQFTALISLFLNELVKQHHGLDYRYAEHEIGHFFFNGAILPFSDYESKEYPIMIQLWLNRFFIVDKTFVPVVLVEEDEDQGFWINIGVQEKTQKVNVPVPLHQVLHKDQYQEIRLTVLRDLALLSDYFPTINELVAQQGKEDLFFDTEEFVDVLFKIIPTIRLFGIKVLLPKALRKLLRPQMSMQVSTEEENGLVQKPSIVNLENMLQFQWQIALGDQLLSEAAFLKLLGTYQGIVKLNDQYIFFDEKEIQTLIQRIKNPPSLTSNELLHVALTEDYKGAKVQLDKKTQDLIQGLLSGEAVKVPKGLKATLRPYQLSGYEWLYKNSKIGFGSLIADDMGLGKTLQVITTLLKLQEDGELDQQKALIIVPTTLLTNWLKEINKFAPALKAFVYHGANRNLDLLKSSHVLITTYGVARSEPATFKKHKWLLLAIDEAQNIKNPNTAQTKAIKKIKAPIKIAMSGTPVENRLSEYWSIFDFTNKGYLNTLSKFKNEFAKPIEVDRDQLKLENFRKITAPFILRRLKSDKSIIKDLPDKIEQDQFCQLNPEQAALYQNVVDTTMKNIDAAEGIARKGLILKLLTALKQICNHPTQFLKKGAADPSLSGKAMLLFDLIRQIQEQGEKTLIFTQYREMGDLLVEMLSSAFHLEIPFLHGGISRKGRDAMVEDFQDNRSTRIMILSLKAGGTGLNLTEASNVIHYDLWWNPAVEAQATDRAYRIGQQRNVMVHRFITQGTFEEKINQLLQEKKELANLAVATGERWLGDLPGAELRELVALG